MKFKVAIIAAILSINAISFAMEKDTCTMPSAEVIRERFQGFDHFLEKTNLVQQLAGQEKHPFGVAMAVDLALHDYNAYLAKGTPAPMLRMLQAQNQMNKPLFIRLLLQDCPTALTELEKAGLYKPVGK